MSIYKYKDIIYYTGKILKIVWAVDSNDNINGKDYFESIGVPNWSKLDRILHRLADKGKIINKQQFRSVGDGLFEVKGGAERLVGFFMPGHFAVTHGFSKRGGGKSANKFPENQRDKALRIRKEFRVIFKKMKKGGK